MAQVSGGIIITGTIDGSSLIGSIAVGGQYDTNKGYATPITQYYDGASYSPDFEALYNNGSGLSKVPALYVKMDDPASGSDLTGNVSIPSTGVKYNGTTVEWNSSGMATSPSIVAGKLLKGKMTYGSKQIDCVRIIGNIVSDTNIENDEISFAGTCSAFGADISFSNLSTPIELRKVESIDTFSLRLYVPNGQNSYISKSTAAGSVGRTIPTQRVAELRKGIAVVSEGLAGYKCVWSDITHATNVDIQDDSLPAGITLSKTNITNDTIIIDDQYVNSQAVMACRVVSISDNKVVASATTVVMDFSDDPQLRWLMAPYDGSFADAVLVGSGSDIANGDAEKYTMRKGQKLKFLPVVYSRETGTKADVQPSSWSFSFDDADGNKISGMGSSNVGTDNTYGRYAFVDYTDVVVSNNGVQTHRPVYLSATGTVNTNA